MSRKSSAVRSGLYHRLFAWMLAHGEGLERRLYAPRKTDLLGELRGTVVEIGPGSGLNLEHYHPSVTCIAVEPNVHFHVRIRAEAERRGIEVQVIAGIAEDLPIEDESVDAVVSTLVLCSVDDLALALDEIRRVLRPGGRFVFLEHVAAPEGSMLGRVQRAVRRPWGWMADGCRPDRKTGQAILDAGFEEAHIEEFEIPIGLLRPHIRGVAVKAESQQAAD